MSSKKISEKKQRNNYKEACWKGYCPTSAERENSRIKELANRLKSASDKETLTNVLDWQNRNVVFWFERYPLSEAVWASVLGIIATSSLFIVNRSIWFWCFAVLLSVLVTLLLIAVYMLHSYRKLPLKQVFNIFLPSMSINSILDNKLCVCRDYAKLTACLLFKIYPEREIYFVQAPSHVATGIMVENKLYILDKYLPLATINSWHNKWHKCRFSKKKVERVKGTSMESVELNSLLSTANSSELDTVKIANEMKRLLSSHRSLDNPKRDSLTILQWKKGAILYDDDEIVNYSLAQRLKTVMSNEMIDINRVTNLAIDQKKDDLIFRVEL